MSYMPKFIHNEAEFSHTLTANGEAELLKKLCRERVSQLPGSIQLAGPIAAYLSRLEKELGIILRKGFCGYFLIVADYVQWAKNNGIAVGPGRGSGPCSLVGFVLGITTIDPIKHSLPFERFINPDKNSLPDFDLDFCDERRDEVTNYLQSTYHPERVAYLSADNIPLPSRLVICDRPVANVVPLLSHRNSTLPVARINTTQVADAGLVQFNVINQKALTIIQRTVQEIAQTGKAIDINNIALNDGGTYQLLGAGEQSNISILDSTQYKSALTTVQPECFTELCAVIALAHPGLPEHASHFLAHKQEFAPTHHFHPALATITAETYGLILYQEQVMLIAEKLAGFTLAQGDLLRRALKRPNKPADQNSLPMFGKKFISGAMSKGLSHTVSSKLFEHIALSPYQYFNKSHAVAFATLAYQSAWLHANHPRAYTKVVSLIN